MKTINPVCSSTPCQRCVKFWTHLAVPKLDGSIPASGHVAPWEAATGGHMRDEIQHLPVCLLRCNLRRLFWPYEQQTALCIALWSRPRTLQEHVHRKLVPIDDAIRIRVDAVEQLSNGFLRDNFTTQPFGKCTLGIASGQETNWWASWHQEGMYIALNFQAYIHQV